MAPEPISPEEAYRRKVNDIRIQTGTTFADKRQIVGVNDRTVTNVSSTNFPGHYPGENHAWDLEEFRNVTLVPP